VAISSIQLIQINATVIAGLLVLLGITAQQTKDIMTSVEEEDLLTLELAILTQIMIKSLIIPFALSATIEIIHSQRKKEQDNHASKLGVIIATIGFIFVFLFFLLEVIGGLAILYGNFEP